MSVRAAIIMVLLLVPALAVAEPRGLPFVTWYTPADYGAGTQNWAVAQDHRGYMYFGNEGVVLVFDSARWRRVPILGGRAVRSLATTADGRVLVGTQGDFGLLEENEFGDMRYRSLRDRFPDDMAPFHDVWQVFALGDRWLFSTDSAVFELNGTSARTLRSHAPVAASFRVGDDVYTYFDGGGLMRLGRDGFEALPGLDDLPAPVYAVLALDDGDLMIGLRPGGLLRYRVAQATLSPDWLEAGRLLERHHLYHARRVADGRIAFATLRGGLLLLDEASGAVEILDPQRGLPNPTVRHVFVDAESGTWLALDNGIARIEGHAAVDVWDERSGLPGSALCALRHDGTLYVGTTVGLFLLEGSRFRAVEGIESEVWSLLEQAADDGTGRLLAATSYGVHAIDGASAAPLYGPHLAVALAQSSRRPQRLWIGTYDQGLGYVDLDSGRSEPIFLDLDVQARGLRLDAEGDLWLETWTDGLFHIDADLAAVLRRYPNGEGPSEDAGLNVLMTPRHRLLAGREGIWRMDEEGRMQRARDLESLLATPGGGSVMMVEGPEDVLWSAAADDFRQWLRLADLRGQARPHALDAHLRRLPDIEFYMVYPEGDRLAWIGASEALYRLDMRMGAKASRALAVHMVAVAHASAALPLVPMESEATLAGRHFPLRFSVAAPSFDWPGGTSYRFRLAGFDDAWSAWQGTGEREFSHLPPGDYVLQVQARDVYGQEAETDYAFRVLAPWYLQRPMLAVYLLLAAVLMATLMHVGGRRQARRSRELEAIVALRTRELREQQDLLEAERDKLARLSREDELTGLANRRAAKERMRSEWARAERHGGHLALAVIDIDHFKAVNDRFGHECGDSVLHRFAEVLAEHCRQTDLVARWGGEEFLLILPEADLEAARASCERIRHAVAAADWARLIPNLRLSVSIGLATREGRTSWEQMLAAADRCLYQAKARGRDRVVTEVL
ncbi:MAG TPA: diguanylate cyclase [Xanthomonadaceae bacterium]|nr:diguanylate cyclase [Xanthomonadaceae bacterium]